MYGKCKIYLRTNPFEIFYVAHSQCLCARQMANKSLPRTTLCHVSFPCFAKCHMDMNSLTETKTKFSILSFENGLTKLATIQMQCALGVGHTNRSQGFSLWKFRLSCILGWCDMQIAQFNVFVNKIKIWVSQTDTDTQPNGRTFSAALALTTAHLAVVVTRIIVILHLSLKRRDRHTHRVFICFSTHKNSSMSRREWLRPFTDESKQLNIWFLSLYQAEQQSIIYSILDCTHTAFPMQVYWTMFRRKVHICRRLSHAWNTNIEACLLIDFSVILRSICVNVWNVLATHNYGDTLRSFVRFLLLLRALLPFAARCQ